MRSRERIEPFLKELGQVWKDEFTDWRFGQFMSNWLGWVQTVKERDIFFPEEEEMLALLYEYVEKVKGIKTYEDS